MGDDDDHEFPLDRIAILDTRDAPLEEINAALDELLARPDGDALRVGVEHERVIIHCRRNRPVTECEALLASYMTIDNDLPLRADTVDLAYVLRPELDPQYLDAMISQLIAAQPRPQQAKSRLKARLKRLLKRRTMITERCGGESRRSEGTDPEPSAGKLA